MLLFTLYLVLVVALPVLLSGLIGLRGLPRGNSCPACAHETIPLCSLPVRAARRVYGGFSLQRRWCPVCEWEGYARPVTLEHVATTTAGDPRQTEQVRTLELGGRPWHVMLESWRERGRVYGRLLFVGPSGRRWYDPLPGFSGPTRHEVLHQAQALSDRLLAYRLREVISG